VLRRLAERHGLLPDRLRITEKIEFSDEVLAFGGFGDIRSGTYNGSVVAFKSMRVATLDNFLKIRKVSVGIDHLERDLSHPYPAILQGGRTLGKVIPSERLEASWGLGRYGERTVRHCGRVDGAREHRGLH